MEVGVDDQIVLVAPPVDVPLPHGEAQQKPSDDHMAAQEEAVRDAGDAVASGIYYLRLETRDFMQVRTMTLVR